MNSKMHLKRQNQ